MSLDRYGAAFVNFFARYSNNKQFVLKPAKYHLSLKRNAKSGRKTKSIETADCYQHKKKLKMRKIYNICLFVGVIALMLSACKKDNQNQIFQNTGEEVYWTAEDLKIQNNILSFQDKIKNNSFKSGETLELDSAVWYLEALMNYNYSTPDSSFVNLTVDTTFEFNLPVNDDLVDFSNLSEAAFAMEEHIVNYLNNMPNSIKFMVVADVHIKDDDFKSGSKTISITTGYGSEYIDNPSAYTPFGEDDYWYYGDGYMDNGGYCDGPNEGQETGSDAAEEIDACLEPEEMNFYLQGTLDVIEMVIEEKQSEYPGENIEFIYVDLVGSIWVEDATVAFMHLATITYGKRVMRVPPTE
jgi:hypothetical protein